MERFKNFYVMHNQENEEWDCNLCEGNNKDGTCIATGCDCPLKLNYYFKKR